MPICPLFLEKMRLGYYLNVNHLCNNLGKNPSCVHGTHSAIGNDEKTLLEMSDVSPDFKSRAVKVCREVNERRGEDGT
jgi:hypothetical protein